MKIQLILFHFPFLFWIKWVEVKILHLFYYFIFYFGSQSLYILFFSLWAAARHKQHYIQTTFPISHSTYRSSIGHSSSSQMWMLWTLFCFFVWTSSGPAEHDHGKRVGQVCGHRPGHSVGRLGTSVCFQNGKVLWLCR